MVNLNLFLIEVFIAYHMLHVNYRDIYHNRDNFACNNCNM